MIRFSTTTKTYFSFLFSYMHLHYYTIGMYWRVCTVGRCVLENGRNHCAYAYKEQQNLWLWNFFIDSMGFFSSSSSSSCSSFFLIVDSLSNALDVMVGGSSSMKIIFSSFIVHHSIHILRTHTHTNASTIPNQQYTQRKRLNGAYAYIYRDFSFFLSSTFYTHKYGTGVLCARTEKSFEYFPIYIFQHHRIIHSVCSSFSFPIFFFGSSSETQKSCM